MNQFQDYDAEEGWAQCRQKELALAYEAAKIAWRQSHPHSTPAQYESAMTTIAARLGV